MVLNEDSVTLSERYLENLCGYLDLYHLWGYYGHLLVGGHDVSCTVKNIPSQQELWVSCQIAL